MKHPPERDWMIVAPWWRWTDPATVPAGQPVKPDPAQGRLSVPVFQKYDSPALVNNFIADPQRCLKFVDDDLTHHVRTIAGAVTTPAGKLLRIQSTRDLATLAEPIPTPIPAAEYVVDDDPVRKIFLATHKRHYLVVCEMHCDGPGFPKVARDKVCQAGFVIRRRTTTAPSADPAPVKPLLKKLAVTRMKIARVNQLTEIEQSALATATGASPVRSAKLDTLLRARRSLAAVLAADRERFEAWTLKLSIRWQLQGWFPSATSDKIGSWKPVHETPDDPGDESVFPLYPLIPDPNDPGHAGRDATVYFGVLPTASHDSDASGRPRWDDQEFYELRCWVRRHLEPHDPDQPCRCPDGCFWSRPSEAYKLASHFDLTGTGHQPVTIQLPSLAELAAQAAKPAFGAGFAKPPGSLMFSVDASAGKATNPSLSPKFEICFIPIPLITIVATFVLELFLPIVVVLFQLWWMLALRFCIPPQFSASAGIKAELKASGGFGIGVDADGSIDLDTTQANLLNAELHKDLTTAYGDPLTGSLEAVFAPAALANLDVSTHADASMAPEASLPQLDVDPETEPEVTRA